MRFQQTSAAVMAKGLEDTAFYSFNRMIALNDVGGDPEAFGITQPPSIDGRGRLTRNGRARCWRPPLTTPSGAKTYARACSCSLRFPSVGQRVPPMVGNERPYRSGEFPDRNLEYHLYQAIVGAWPIEKDRIIRYAEKAAREAKVHTSWTERNEEYEAALRKFIEGIYGDSRFCRSVGEFVAGIIRSGSRQLARADSDQADRARRSRFLPGQRAMGPVSGRSGQSPSCQISRAAAHC